MSAANKSGGMKVKPSSGINKGGPSSSSIGNSKVDSKHKSVSITEVKTKATTGSSKTVTTTVTKTREKKVFSLPGQKYDIPEEREPLRIFYESLSEQIPSSEMAEFWLMEHGMLSPDRAKKAFEKKQKKQKQIRMGTPIKSPPTPTPESSKRPQQVSKNGEVKAKKRIIDDTDTDDDDDDRFVIGNKRRMG